MSLLEVTQLNLRLGQRQVLEQVSMHLENGEILGLIGPNGAGKTSLLRVCARLQRPASGEVLLQGKSVQRLPSAKLSRQLAYLPQSDNVHWPLSVERLVALGRLPHLPSWQRPGAADEAAIEQAMLAADVSQFRTARVTELSGGERRRVLLARALAVQADLLLADEPVAALDPAHQLRVMKVLREHARAGHGVIAVMHDLALAAEYCDRLLLLDAGKLVAQGNAQTVLTPKNLAEIYNIRAADPEISALPWMLLS